MTLSVPVAAVGSCWSGDEGSCVRRRVNTLWCWKVYGYFAFFSFYPRILNLRLGIRKTGSEQVCVRSALLGPTGQG